MEREPISTVGVVGAGQMGGLIALQAARHGFPVVVSDVSAEALARMRRAHEADLDRRLAAGEIGAAERAAVLGRVRVATGLADVAAADLVIEAVPERLALKRAVFADLDRLAPPRTILATNSSAIRVSRIEDATNRPDRVLNLHFNAPAPPVELMRGSATSEATIERARGFVRAIGMVPLVVRRESTGFLFNRIWRAVKRDALAVVDAGIASAEEVDRAWMLCWDQPIGPFGIMDEVGLDVVLDIERVYHEESGDPADAPPRVLVEMVERGDLGAKSGRGFYAHPNPAYLSRAWLWGEEEEEAAGAGGGESANPRPDGRAG